MTDPTIAALAGQARVPSLLRASVTPEAWSTMATADRVNALERAMKGTIDVTPSSSSPAPAPSMPPDVPGERVAAPPIVLGPGLPTGETSGVPAVNPAAGPLAPTRRGGVDIVALARLDSPPGRLPILKSEWDTLDEMGRAERISILMEELEISMTDVKPDFPKVAMPKEGLKWKMPDGTFQDEVAGIIVFSSEKRAWWESQQITNSLPDCAADNGRVPNTGKGPVVSGAFFDELRRKIKTARDNNDVDNGATSCMRCPYSKYGTGKEGRGQACKQIKDVFIWQEGQQVPYHLPLPPTSLKPFDVYVTGCINASPARPLSTIVTSLSLVPKKNYAIVALKQAGDVDWHVTAAVRALRQRFIEAMTKRGITEADVTIVEHAGGDAPPDEDSPPPRTDKDAPDDFVRGGRPRF